MIHTPPPQPTAAASDYLTAKQAAAYLGIPYSTFRKKATGIPQCRRTRRYHKAALDRWAQHR